MPSEDLKESGEYTPLPWQAEAHASRARHVLVGGAVGPGKSRFLVQSAHSLAKRYPGVPILMARRDLTDIKKSTEIEWQKVIDQRLFSAEWGGQYNKSERWYRYPNGSMVYFGEMKDWESYKSMELGRIEYDELTEISEDNYSNMDARLRWVTGQGECDRRECFEMAGPNWRPHPTHPLYQNISATNPGPGWVKGRFVDGERPRHYFKQLTTYDNPFLPPDYIPSLLENHTRSWVENMVNGRWESFEGMVFEVWNRALHNHHGALPHFVRVFGGIDYGANAGDDAHKTAAILTGETERGSFITFWEYYKQGSATNDFYEELFRVQRKHNVTEWYADANANRTNELLAQKGLRVSDAPRHHGAVVDGINQITRLLTPNAAGEPQLRVVIDACPGLVSEIEAYQWRKAPTATPDAPVPKEPVKKEDDALDGWRYGIMGAVGEEGISNLGLRAIDVVTIGADGKARVGSIIDQRRRDRHERLKRFLEEQHA